MRYNKTIEFMYQSESSKMKVITILAVMIVFLSLMVCDLTAVEKNKVQVLKRGDNVFIRSWYSPTQDVVLLIRKGSNRQINFYSAAFIPKELKMTADYNGKSGIIIHRCGDDTSPWHLNGTYIGGNHGCSDGLELTIVNHGLSAKNIGDEWKDEQGHKFYIVKILDSNKVWLLSENIGKGSIWRFHKKIKGKKLINVKTGKSLEFSGLKRIQLRPCCRFTKQVYLIDGKTSLKDDEVVTCNSFDIIDEYEIICPDSLLESIRKNPGKTANFIGKDLDAVVRNEITYRFSPMGACVLYYKAEALREFNLGHMMFIMTAALNEKSFATHEYYIPKTIPFVKKGVKYDFKNIQDYCGPLPVQLQFKSSEKNIENPDNPPERFIQLLGKKMDDKIKREVGYVIGYSLTQGITVPQSRSQKTECPLLIHTTKKTYPRVIDGKTVHIIHAGEKFNCIAYRQYFDPQLNVDTTCLYWNKQGENDILYADFHKGVKKAFLKVPDYMIGRRISIVEKSPSVSLLSGDTVAREGIAVSVKGNYGYVVLKIKSVK